MRYIIKIFLVFIFFVTANSMAQNNKIEKGNKQYDHNAFIDAQRAYLTVVEKGFRSEDIFEKLGDSYYFVADYANAVKWYAALYDEYHATIEPDYLYMYAQSLKTTKDYEVSDKIMNEFYEVNESDNRAGFFQ